MKPLAVERAQTEYNFLCLRFIYAPQYSPLKHTQFLFFPWGGIKIFIIPIKQHAKLCDSYCSHCGVVKVPL